MSSPKDTKTALQKQQETVVRVEKHRANKKQKICNEAAREKHNDSRTPSNLEPFATSASNLEPFATSASKLKPAMIFIFNRYELLLLIPISLLNSDCYSPYLLSTTAYF